MIPVARYTAPLYVGEIVQPPRLPHERWPDAFVSAVDGVVEICDHAGRWSPVAVAQGASYAISVTGLRLPDTGVAMPPRLLATLLWL